MNKLLTAIMIGTASLVASHMGQDINSTEAEASATASAATISDSDKATLLTRHSYLYGREGFPMASSLINNFRELTNSLYIAKTKEVPGAIAGEEKALRALQYRLTNYYNFMSHDGPFSAADELLTIRLGIDKSNEAFEFITAYKTEMKAARNALEENNFDGVSSHLDRAIEKLKAAEVIYRSAQ